MPFLYESGEQIAKGDRVLLHGNPAEVAFVAEPAQDAGDWYVREYGGGIMIMEPKVFGRLFLRPTDSDYVDLKFVSRHAIEEERPA